MGKYNLKKANIIVKCGSIHYNNYTFTLEILKCKRQI